jgi:hypothetical protein
MINVTPNYQTLQLKQHNEKENHYKACAVTMYCIVDNHIQQYIPWALNSARIITESTKPIKPAVQRKRGIKRHYFMVC